MKWIAEWITTGKRPAGCPVFKKNWKSRNEVDKAFLYITAIGVYEAFLNGMRAGRYVLAPGWTSYETRLQYQCYDVTDLLQAENELQVTIGKGWAISPMPGFTDTPGKKKRTEKKMSLLAQLVITYTDGCEECIGTDGSWMWAESSVRFSEIYDGEMKDAAYEPSGWERAEPADLPMTQLIPQEGPEIRETERVAAKELIRTPAGDLVVDFGQEVTGYVEFTVDAKAGDRIHLLHGEVLDQEGNFYNSNYRSAKAEITYICREGRQTWHPELTFFGFRFVKLDAFPGTPDVSQFTAVVVCSDIRQTGRVETSDPLLGQLISNVFWGQKGNFLDVPTDCPQRDERLGWTGDAQAFVKAASYNYDVEKFFAKWLHDLKADQRQDGSIGQVIPDYMDGAPPSAGWGDAAVICPWQIYMTYGNPEILRDQFESMKRWVDYIEETTARENLWTGGTHFGDWLGLDAPSGSFKGSSREDFIASAFYAYSTSLVIKAGHALGEDISAYEAKYPRIVEAFRSEYPEYLTQTECVLAVQFGLAADAQKAADQLAEMIRANDSAMQTGFIGTPYLLHVLSDHGHAHLAYTLLLRKEYPSWLYSVRKGATTIWEHWDGIRADGSFWSDKMNSFNHYAYGSVIDWIYEKAAGIQTVEDAPGFAGVRVMPLPDPRIGWLHASIETRHGLVSSGWKWIGDNVRYEIEVPVEAEIVTGGKKCLVSPGSYVFWS